MRAVLAGENVLAVMPTGSGKSLCFQLPAIARPGLTLVVSPLIALMRDQVQALTAAGVAAGSLNSSNEPAENARVMGLLRRRELRLLYVAPERLARPDTVEMLAEAQVTDDGDRRGALRLAMGPRLPARLSHAWAISRARSAAACRRWPSPPPPTRRPAATSSRSCSPPSRASSCAASTGPISSSPSSPRSARRARSCPSCRRIRARAASSTAASRRKVEELAETLKDAGHQRAAVSRRPREDGA